MSFSTEVSDDGCQLKININGRFDFSTHQEFRSCYEVLDSQPLTYNLDMKDATYLDSSALGMLLLLRDHAGGNNSQIKITNCSPDVKKVLTISNFQQLFTIH